MFTHNLHRFQASFSAKQRQNLRCSVRKTTKVRRGSRRRKEYGKEPVTVTSNMTALKQFHSKSQTQDLSRECSRAQCACARVARAQPQKFCARVRARSAKRQKMFIGSRAVSLTPANCDAKVRGRSCKRLKRRIAYVEKEMRKAKKIKSN